MLGPRLNTKYGIPSPQRVKAKYTPAPLPEYAGNPLTETLPDTLSQVDLWRALRYPRPVCTDQDRNRDPFLRIKAIRRIRDLFTAFDGHYNLYLSISGAIEWGYKSRNPLLPGASGNLAKMIRETERALKDGRVAAGQIPESKAQGFHIVGVSGMGKSTAVRRILGLYPQLIVHSSYSHRRFTENQIVYLHLECPAKGGLKGLATSFIEAVDTLIPDVNYGGKYGVKRASTEWLSTAIASIARNHHLGILVIDEIQNLRKNGEAEAILNFLVGLINKMNVPVVLIGTPDAMRVFSKFRFVRRGTGEGGDIEWDRMRETDKEWRMLVMDLQKFQYTKSLIELTDAHKAVLYDESQGITDLAVKIFALSQVRAILQGGDEIVTPDLIRQTAQSCFSMCQGALEALRRGDMDALQKVGFDDAVLQSVFEQHLNAGIRAAEQRHSLEVVEDYHGDVSKDADRIDDIAAWVMQGGVETSVALRAAGKAVGELGPDADLGKLRMKAMHIAFELSNGEGSPPSGEDTEGATKARTKKGRPRPVEASGLVKAIKDGKKEGKTEYEALQESGFILRSGNVD